MAKVLVGFSGGVDSAVVAALLKSQGHEVFGYTLKLFESTSDESEGCCTFKDIRDAKIVCDKMGIDFIVANWKKIFNDQVVQKYLTGVKNGISYNPCVSCNSTIKLPVLVAVANHFGFDYVATGHYARISDGKIAKAANPKKDQSYFLWETPTHLVRRFLFPLGEIESKTDTRKMASDFGLHVATKPDSTDLCFFERGTKEEFLDRNGVKSSQGLIIDGVTGITLGEHQGHHRYTSGQRVSLGGGKAPRYVLRVVPEVNEVYVASREQCQTDNVRLVGCRLDFEVTEGITAVLRYHSKPIPVSSVVRGANNTASVELSESVFGVASGQSCVFYKNDVVMGGGVIE